MVFTDQNFSTEVKEFQGVVLIDFWAPWCGPCQMLGPVVDELVKDYEGKAKIGKMNVDENSDIPSEMGVMGIPAIKIFKDGSLVEELTGVQSKEVLSAKIDQYI